MQQFGGKLTTASGRCATSGLSRPERAGRLLPDPRLPRPSGKLEIGPVTQGGGEDPAVSSILIAMPQIGSSRGQSIYLCTRRRVGIDEQIWTTPVASHLAASPPKASRRPALRRLHRGCVSNNMALRDLDILGGAKRACWHSVTALELMPRLSEFKGQAAKISIDLTCPVLNEYRRRPENRYSINRA